MQLSVTLLALASTAAAHSTWQQLWVGAQDMESTCVYMPPNNSPITDVTSASIACNGGTTKPASACTVGAGGEVTVEMHSHADRSCDNEAIGGAHHGPVLVYLSKVGDALADDGTSGSWIKIFEAGYDAATEKWGNDVLNDNCGKQKVTIPSDLAAGDYLLRAETIALHAASQEGGAQFYMSCYALKVTGGGSAAPSGVKLPGAYSATDPGIKFNLYQSPIEYTIPGPAVYSG